MQIDRLTHGSISAMFKAYDSKDDEIEAMYTGDALDRSSMQRLLEYLRSTSARRLQGSDVTTVTSMDVSVELVNRLGPVRVTLTGEATIQAALLAKGDPVGWSSATVMHKRRLKPSVEVHEHRFRVNMKREETLKDIGELQSARAMACSWDPGSRKVYRMKRRFSFPSSDPSFRYDVTAVRQITHPSPTWAEMGAVPERYEVECEFISQNPDAPEKHLASSLLKCFGTLLKVLDDTDFLLTVSQRNSVLTEFLTLMHPSDRPTWSAQVVAGSVQHKFLPGPKPVTLEMHHLLEHGGSQRAVPSCEEDIQDTPQGTVSVVGGTPYTVTEKADGVHRVLFVSAQGKAYTLSVDGVIKVRDTGLRCRAAGRGSSSIIDGEYIAGNSSTGSLFAAYDAFFFEGGDVRRLELMRKAKDTSSAAVSDKKKSKGETRMERVVSRIDACQVVASALAESSSAVQGTGMRMMVKKFMRYEGDMDGLTACVRQVMARRDSKNYPYSIDGVILTPATWAMGAMSGAPNATAQSDGTWHATLKWKPPEQNSIDFLVRIIPGEIVRRKNASYRVAHLFVGYNPAKWDPVTTLALLTDAATPAARKAAGAYVERWFGVPGEQTGLHVCHLRVEDGDEDRMLCQSGEEVVDATIVEFTFDMEREDDLPVSFCWIPLRPRPDKTLRFTTSGGEITGAANDIGSALSVWMSILSPITEDVMCGRASRKQEHKDLPAAYYINKIRPGDGGMASMRDFHGWVKSTDLLLRLKGNTTRSLFDIGCGRAGDLHTWRKLGVSRVLGVDLYRAGIVDPENGGNMRILEVKKRNGRVGEPIPRIVLLQMDASKPIDAVQIDALDEASGDRQVARVVWSLVDSSSIKDDRLRRYHGFAGAGGFDVVSCQFAVHYFFSTPITLRAFAANVAKHIRPGGFFVGTCMDAHRVHAALGEKQCIQGVVAGKVIWRIHRLYKGFDPSADCRGNTGLRIKVYVQTIGQPLEEFLVDYRLLRVAMAEVGLVPPDASQLSGLGLSAKDVPEGTCTFEAAFERLRGQCADGQHENEKDRHTTSSLQMSDDEKAFSFLNRWFIFVKTSRSRTI